MEFLYDLTYADESGEETHEQHIFDEVGSIIEEAEDFLLIDMFLFNDDYDHGDPELDFPPLSADLAEQLIDKQQNNLDMNIVFITDPINSFYGTYEPDHFNRMRKAGIHLIETDLAPLRDPNPLYTSVYRSYLSWFGTSDSEWLVNALRPQGPEVNLKSYFGMLNFKANHRKTIMNENEGLITSANPHDASFYHSNVAFKFQGEILNDLMASERAVLDMADMDTSVFDDFEVNTNNSSDGPYEIQLVTERYVKDSTLAMIEEAGTEDNIKIGMFYLSDRDIINALKNALERDVNIQMILDVNQDAFGNEKIGVPNRPVAAEFMDMDNPPEIRWYESHGEQYHAKFLMVESSDEVKLTGGSTNLTRRNLDDYNLETNVVISGPKGAEEIDKIMKYYDRLWNNENGTYTVDYETYEEDNMFKNILYRIQEFTGLSTF